MDNIGVVSAEQGVVNQSDLSTQKRQDVKTQQAAVKVPEAELPPYLVALKERIQEIADRLKTAVENEPSTAGKSEKSSDYHKMLIDELAKWKTEVSTPKSTPGSDMTLIGQMPVYPFNRSFMDVYYNYIQKIASGEDVSSEKMVGDLQGRLDAIGTGGAAKQPADAVSAPEQATAPAPAPMKTIDQVI
jgi:hypothetical protein